MPGTQNLENPPITNPYTLKNAKKYVNALAYFIKKDGEEGKAFVIEILDKSGSEIKCTMFNEQADKFYSMLEVGEIYEFSGGRVKVANKRY